MKHLIIILSTFLTVGCGSNKPIVSDVKRTVTDSIVTKTTYVPVKDTIVISGDTVRIKVPIYKLSETPIVSKSLSGRTTASIRKIDDKVQVNCFTDRYEQIIEKQNKIIETLTTRLEKTNQSQTITEFKTPWYSKALSYVGIAAILIVGALLGFKFLKPF